MLQQDGASPHWSRPARSPDLLVLCQRQGLKDYCQRHRQSLGKKIQKAVRSVTADMIGATWRELRKCLVFMIEHNGGHVEAYHH